MNWCKKIATFSLFICVSGCGVKGDPLPPEKPAEIGRGRPTYKRATEGMRIQKAPVEVDEEESEAEGGEQDAE